MHLTAVFDEGRVKDQGLTEEAILVSAWRLAIVDIDAAL